MATKQVTVNASTITIHKGKVGNPRGNPDNLKSNDHKGHLSKSSRKKLINRVSNWFMAKCYTYTDGILRRKKQATRFTFLTLTLPVNQQHSDQEIKSRCLDNFLEIMRKKYKVFEYVWRAEKQANGSIHFHLILDRYIPKSFADKSWWSSLNLLGYIDAFEKQHGHRRPPTNKIECIKSKKQVMCYVVKYVAKIDDSPAVNGRLWYTSKSLQSDAKGRSYIDYYTLQALWFNLTSKGVYVYENTYCIKFYMASPEDATILPINIREAWLECIQYYHVRAGCADSYNKQFKFEFPELNKVNYPHLFSVN